MKNVDEAWRQHDLQPKKFKRCKIHLVDPFNAKCKILEDGTIEDDKEDKGKKEVVIRSLREV